MTFFGKAFLNSLFDHCYQRNIYKQSLISREINEKYCRNVFVTYKLIQTTIQIYLYLNIRHEQISQYICIKKFIRTNAEEIFVQQIFQYLIIFVILSTKKCFADNLRDETKMKMTTSAVSNLFPH